MEAKNSAGAITPSSKRLRTEGEGVRREVEGSGLVRRFEDAVDWSEQNVPEAKRELVRKKNSEEKGQGERRGVRSTMVVRMLPSECKLDARQRQIRRTSKCTRRFAPLEVFEVGVVLERESLDADALVRVPALPH